MIQQNMTVFNSYFSHAYHFRLLHLPRLPRAQSLDHSNRCPFCRQSLSAHIMPQRQAVNRALQAVAAHVLPTALAEVQYPTTTHPFIFSQIFLRSLMSDGLSFARARARRYIKW
jgi:hypothetical protein